MKANSDLAARAPASLAPLTVSAPRLRRTLHHDLMPYTCHRPAGAILCHESDATPMVLCIHSGWVTVGKSLEDGDRQILDFLLPGEVIGAISADTESAAVQLEALTDVSVAMLPQKVCARLSQERPDLRLKLERNIAARLSRMSERMLRLGKSCAEGRIAYAICEFFLRLKGAGLENGAELRIPMTQQQLGDFTGLSSVHVCRTLRRFGRNGIVSVRGQMHLVIHDADSLAEIAEIDPERLWTRIVPAA